MTTITQGKENPFIIDVDGIIIPVVLSETLTLSSGSFDWYKSEEAALKAYAEEKIATAENAQDDWVSQVGLVYVQVSGDRTDDDITDQLDFNIDALMHHSGTATFPLTIEAWKVLLEKSL